jgi:hypothetical protein
MLTRTRSKLVSAVGLTALFVLASVGTAITVTPSPSNQEQVPASTQMIAATPSSHPPGYGPSNHPGPPGVRSRTRTRAPA